jgi:hypothetical protein
MNSLIVIAVIVVLFGVLAWKNWRKTIGAGPTILIVGALALFAYWGFSYSHAQDTRERARIQHDSLVADYTACAAKVDRSLGSREYNLALIAVIQREIPSRPDIAQELTEELNRDLPALTLEHDCPPNPNAPGR